MDILEKLRGFTPIWDSEKQDVEAFIAFLEENTDAFSRENTNGHATASSWIVNKDRTKVLFCYHKLYDSWSWIGGHADGETDLLRVALKECIEETGVEPLSYSSDILTVERLPVAAHMKKGKYVKEHTHYNVTYLITADENAPLKIAPEENTDLRWFTFEEALEASTEPWMVENIYKKIIAKCEML